MQSAHALAFVGRGAGVSPKKSLRGMVFPLVFFPFLPENQKTIFSNTILYNAL